MKVVQLIPGTGGTFYCQNCMRDGALVRALRKRSVDVTLVPLYLPLTVDAEGLEDHAPVFFGGINVYLQQEFSVFRKTPRWVDRIFDSDWMLKQAAAREGSTSAAALGPMTLSMLQGRNGRQRKEVDRLAEWLRDYEKPDIIHASNSLLLGVAVELKKTFGIPVVCSLQDEHTWLDAIPEPHGSECWRTMSEQAREVDAFIAVSEWYAGEMSARMNIPREKMSVVPVGMEYDGIEPATGPGDPPAIGYLSRMTEWLGFGELVDAFIELKQKPELKNLKFRASGGNTAEDKPFLDRMRANIREAGFEDDAEFAEHFDKAARHEFLRSLSVVSVPVPGGEAFGVFILEALACGVPVVQPAVGGFTENVEKTGGGLLYDPEEPKGLTNALAELLLDPNRAHELGARGREAVLREYSVEKTSEKVLNVYNAVAQ